MTPDVSELVERLELAAKAATPGPYDHMPGRNLVRAIRDDLAVPLFEALEPYSDPLLTAPTCRVGKEVVFRANTAAARDSAAMKQQWRNAAFIALANPENILALCATLKALAVVGFSPSAQGEPIPTEPEAGPEVGL